MSSLKKLFDVIRKPLAIFLFIVVIAGCYMFVLGVLNSVNVPTGGAMAAVVLVGLVELVLPSILIYRKIWTKKE